jgi:hypothetical protein
MACGRKIDMTMHFYSRALALALLASGSACAKPSAPTREDAFEERADAGVTAPLQVPVAADGGPIEAGRSRIAKEPDHGSDATALIAFQFGPPLQYGCMAHKPSLSGHIADRVLARRAPHGRPSLSLTCTPSLGDFFGPGYEDSLEVPRLPFGPNFQIEYDENGNVVGGAGGISGGFGGGFFNYTTNTVPLGSPHGR